MSRREKNEINAKNIKKRIVISAIFLTIMLCSILLTWKLLSMNKLEKTNGDINDNTLLQNEIENTIVNEETELENNNENIKTNNEVISSEEKTMDEIEKEEDKKEKAITLTKNNWGDDSNVYFTFDSIDEHENYIVYIREKTTTHAIARSIVDIETGTCTLE